MRKGTYQNGWLQWYALAMNLLLIIAVVAVPFAMMWWGMRDVEPKGDGPQENFREATRLDRGWPNGPNPPDGSN